MERDPMERLMELQRGMDVQLLEFAELAADLVAKARDFGVADDIRVNCHLTSQEVHNRICVGREMPELRASVESMRAGKIGFAHLVKLARTYEALGDGFDEQRMLKLAERNSVGKLHHICQHARYAARRDEVAREQAEQVAKRRLEIFRHEDGMVSLHGLFDGIGGATISNAILPLAVRADVDDDRSYERRMADALVELAEGAAPAKIQVTVSAETLLQMKAAAGGEMAGCDPIALETLERLRCDSVLRRVVLDDKSVVIDVGRSRRIVTNPMREALMARDGTCIWPGCLRHGTRCIPHHLRFWSEGGGTSVAGSAMLCAVHHYRVHEGGWRLVPDENGALNPVRPPPQLAVPSG